MRSGRGGTHPRPRFRLPRRLPGGLDPLPLGSRTLDDAAARAACHRRRRFRPGARRPPPPRGRSGQPGTVVGLAGLPLRDRAAAVLPGVVRSRRAVRFHLRPQPVHRAVHGGPVAALHRRVLSGDQSGRLRTRAVARDLPAPWRAGRVGGRRVRLPGVLRGFRSPWPAAQVVGLEHGQPHRQPPRRGGSADEQHAVVRVRLDGGHDLSGRASGRWPGGGRCPATRVVTGAANRGGRGPHTADHGGRRHPVGLLRRGRSQHRCAGLGSRHRAGPDLAGRRLDPRLALEVSGPWDGRAPVHLRAVLPRRLPGWNGRVLDQCPARVLRRG